MKPTNHPFRKEHDLPGCRLVPEKKVPASTPLKTNMSPENQWLEDVFPTKIVPFLGFMLVFRGVILGMWFTIPESPFHDVQMTFEQLAMNPSWEWFLMSYPKVYPQVETSKLVGVWGMTRHSLLGVFLFFVNFEWIPNRCLSLPKDMLDIFKTLKSVPGKSLNIAGLGYQWHPQQQKKTRVTPVELNVCPKHPGALWPSNLTFSQGLEGLRRIPRGKIWRNTLPPWWNQASQLLGGEAVKGGRAGSHECPSGLVVAGGGRLGGLVGGVSHPEKQKNMFFFYKNQQKGHVDRFFCFTLGDGFW